MYFVYILQGINLKHFYKGITNNIEKRILQHESGQHATTKRLIPFKLIHVECCDSRGQARELEIFFKSGYGREVLKQIGEESSI